jgi:FtsZ-binding cell division protein ZapB
MIEIAMNFIELLDSAAFQALKHDDPSAWYGHIPFAAWLLQTHRPKVMVELGTHCGTSYLAFCQAIQAQRLDCRAYAVDTWQGDKHAGGYTGDIFERLNAYHAEHYAQFSHLLRMTFNEALDQFADGSVDLLHIDGLHTYEAVQHDFESWLPKLSPQAVVLFHDTQVRERDFGVWRFWQELEQRYPLHFEFTHSYGLGVLQLSADRSDGSQGLAWLASENTLRPMLQKYFAALGQYQLTAFELLDTRRYLQSQAQAHQETIARLQQASDEAIERLGQTNATSLQAEVAALASANAELRAEQQHLIAERNSLMTNNTVLQRQLRPWYRKLIDCLKRPVD